MTVNAGRQMQPEELHQARNNRLTRSLPAATLQRQHVGVERNQGGSVAHRHHADAPRDAPPETVLL
jgi:hypothetical protein